jgi:hypothetical protein
MGGKGRKSYRILLINSNTLIKKFADLLKAPFLRSTMHREKVQSPRSVKFSQPPNTSLRRHAQRRGTVRDHFLANLACFGLETMLILKIIHVSPIIDF